MAKETVDKDIALIRKLVGTKKLIMGTERVVKALRLGKLEKVYVATNCVKDVEEMLKKYCRLTKATFVKLSYVNDEFGTLCKKPFSVSVIGLVKEK